MGFGTPGSIRQPPNASGFLGQGVQYPLDYDTTGRLKLSFGVQSVADAMMSIALTQPGERVMQPDYGAAIFVAEPLQSLGQIAASFTRNIHEHEPRVKTLNSVDVSLGQDVGAVQVDIVYTPQAEATPQTLSYPYFQGPTGA